jgi:hypothetical protein
MRGAIMQPTYLPWPGYFELISAVDVFVVYDHVQFVRKSWHHRNRIRGSNGEIMLSVPVKKTAQSTPISMVEISYDAKEPLKEHWKSISMAYQKAKFFKEYAAGFEEIFNKKHSLLCELNLALIKIICGILKLEVEFISSQGLHLEDAALGKTERVANICHKTGIDFLYDANGAKSFLDAKVFEIENIQVEFQSYSFPEYHQVYHPFIPYLSVIDLIFNEGSKALEILKSGATRSNA